MQDTNRSRVFIFDPCFGGMTGHWESYCKRFYVELRSRGWEVKVFGQANFEPAIIENVKFEPLFTVSPYTPLHAYSDFSQVADLFLKELRKIDEKQFQDGDIFVFHSIFPHTFSAIVDWIQQLAKQTKIISSCFFQFPPSEAKSQVGWVKRFYYFARRLLKGEKPTGRGMAWVDNNNVRFYQQKIAAMQSIVDRSLLLMASTDVLAHNFKKLFRLPVHCLPMPGEIISEVDRVAQASGVRGEKIKIGYFGHCSLDKGGQFLQYLIEKTLQKFPHVEFIVHANPNVETKPYLNDLMTTTHANVKCYSGHLSQVEYTELLKSTDIILMPYSLKKYSTTPSAVFTEGLLFKKVLVLPENSWADAEAKRYNAGAVRFNCYNRVSILKAIFKAVQNYDRLKQKSVTAGETFYQQNNIQHYVNVFENILNRFYTEVCSEKSRHINSVG